MASIDSSSFQTTNDTAGGFSSRQEMITALYQLVSATPEVRLALPDIDFNEVNFGPKAITRFDFQGLDIQNAIATIPFMGASSSSSEMAMAHDMCSAVILVRSGT